ncbi:MAG TPA: insulinase family protein [Candidatus Limnocylindrales bacterium]|nr:insulinase family protein [Candidatus Limnocylindrales bacterium]
MSGPAHRPRAAILVAALLVFGAAGRAFADDVPAATGTLPSGAAFAVHPDPTQPVAAVSLWYRAPAAGFDARPAPGIARLAAATVAASAPITGTPLTQLVERWGGRVTVSAYPDSVAITAMVPPEHAADAVRAMTADYFAPVTSAAGLRLAQRDVAEDAIFRGMSADAIEDALGAALFETGPLHDGTVGTAQGIAALTLDRVRAFATRAFRPANAIVVLTGNADRTALGGAASRPGSAAGAPEPPAPQTPRAPGTPLAREGLVAGTGLGWAGPPIAAEAEATAMDFLADLLFAPRTGRVPRALGTRKASVSGKFVTYRNPGVFLVTITGADAAAARPIVEQAIAETAKPMSAQAFEAARAAFVYRLLSDMSTPADVAETYGWYTVEGDAPYAPGDGPRGRYFTAAAALTPASVAQTAAKYLGQAPAIVTLTKRAQPRGTQT